MKSKILLYAALVLSALVMLISCGKKEDKGHDFIVVANKPLELIVQELVGDRIDLYCITKPTDSPHTFNPKPSDMQRLELAKLFFYTSDRLDNWVRKDMRKDKIEVIQYIAIEHKQFYGNACCDEFGYTNKEGDCGEGFIDPHFWLDPIAVKGILPKITRDLVNAFPEHSEFINKNKDRFIAELDQLHETIKKELAEQRGAALLSFHASYGYFIARYNLLYAGAIEISPGKEITPKYLNELKRRIEAYQITNIFTEPQLPENSARNLAEIAKVDLQVLDPLGGNDNTMNYRDLLLYNTIQLKKHLNKKAEVENKN